MKLSEARVVLTGASGGIGVAVARRLVGEGARVLLAGRSSAALMALADELSVTHNRSMSDVVVGDVTTDTGRNAIRDAAEACNVNILINNAGVSGFGALHSLSTATLEAAVKTNLLAPMLLTASLLPQLLKQPRSLVLNIGSTLGSIGVPGFAAYGATKAGVRVFSQALRRELLGTAVRIQYLAPRAVKTDFNDPQAKAFNEATGSHADDPDIVALALIKMIRTEQAESYLGTIERMAARLNALFPRLVDGGFANHRRALGALSHPDTSGE